MNEKKPAILLLEDGKIYRGWSLSKNSTAQGEVVFNTGMSGYEEIMTDPSYKEQIITFTYPELGNTGINYQDNESSFPKVKGAIFKNLCLKPSNWRLNETLVEYLNKSNIIEIHGIDTRALTTHLRKFGAMNGIISNEIFDITTLQDKLSQIPSMEGLNLVSAVSSRKAYEWDKATDKEWEFSYLSNEFKHLKIVVIDFGVKFNILRRLKSYGGNVIVVPAHATLEEILTYEPNGVVLSNGPGDPSSAIESIALVKQLLKLQIPILGICMGHQLLNLALGACTFKLKFGHRGLNHPSGLSKKIEITSQNHGFAVNFNSLKVQDINITHLNLNDNTLAGITHLDLPVLSVQHHPEASPGPHDSDYLFKNFLSKVKSYNS
uniref:Carbamoyl phosphate synthase small chain n=1 Tax=Sciadococcus taiwanensis TaxID=3028030 RepID=A0A9Y1I231_9RHOD|nr:carbamoyl-phosphate synthase arginine-specific small subunit [Sciadococcus taiwanensis]